MVRLSGFGGQGELAIRRPSSPSYSPPESRLILSVERLRVGLMNSCGSESRTCQHMGPKL